MYVQNGEIYEGPEEKPVHLDNHTLNLIQRIPWEQKEWDGIMDTEYACGREQPDEDLEMTKWLEQAHEKVIRYGGQRYSFDDCLIYLVNHEEENLFRDNPLLQRLSCMDCQIILGEQLEAMTREDILRLARSRPRGKTDWALFKGNADVARTARPCRRAELRLLHHLTALQHIPGDSKECMASAWRTQPGPLVVSPSDDTRGLELLDPWDIRARVCLEG